MSAAADRAVEYLLQRIKTDPRVAYHFAFTESLALLTAAYAEAKGRDAAAFHKEFELGLKTEAPRCRAGECFEAAERAP